jgi:phosphoglycerol transferase MdoB-like AlkP superfamily enzyme
MLQPQTMGHQGEFVAPPIGRSFGRRLPPLRVIIPSGLGMLFSAFAVLLVLFQLLRLGMLLRNSDLASPADRESIVGSFAVGLRFDCSVAAYIAFAMLAAGELGRRLRGASAERRIYVIGFSFICIVLTVVGMGEFEFFREFSARYNILALQYWSHPVEVMSMIWRGFPVLRYLAVAVVASSIFVSSIVRLSRFWFAAVPAPSPKLIPYVLTLVAVFGVLVVAARGGVQGRPLQWGTEVHCDSMFANQLSYNGFWTLSRGIIDTVAPSTVENTWRTAMPRDEARERTRRLVGLPKDQWTGDLEKYPLLRQSLDGARSVQLQSKGASPNVVVILMESFSARFVGVTGCDANHTPEYDRIANQGILFDRCFSNGTRTHQAHYALGTSFPNLPGYEWLMESNKLGDQRFDSLPAAFKKLGYSTYYLSNGNLSWDNVRHFFQNQGIDRFVGGDDFDSSYFKGTWGVLDDALFERANQEFRQAKGPFFGMIMTASNHVPFQHPRPYPFPEVVGDGRIDNRLNGIRFADWSIGQFMERARHEAYFSNTLFVLVGDHGFTVPEVLTDLNLLKFHVPLVFYAPELLPDCPRRDHRVASHVDIAPTILGLIGDHGAHQHWGRDLFALPPDDPGMAIFRPTGAPELGYARGDLLLVKSRRGLNRLFRYDLGVPPSVVECKDADEELVNEMDKDLRAFVETAQETLTSRHAAP